MLFNFLKIIFIIYGLFLGIIFAYNLSADSKLTDDEKEEAKISMRVMVGSNLKLQKDLLGQMNRFFLWALLLYGIPSLFLFNFNPWMLALSFIFIGISVYRYIRKQKRLEKIKLKSNIIEFDKPKKSLSVISLLIIAIQIGVLL